MKKIIQFKKNNFIKKIIYLDLKNNKYSQIHTRFPPEPNGYLHLGHAKALCLNFGIANDYQGYCNLRFDDTNPKKTKKKYINSIINDIQWLGFKWNGKIHYTSEYFKILYEYAIQLINKELAYVDLLDKNQIKEYRGTLTQKGKNSPYRNHTIEQNIKLFRQMQNGELNPGTACLRAKIDMESNYMIMRDPVLYRIIFSKNDSNHHKWYIYPTYDFSHCISDSIEGITHSLCTLEFTENKKIYDWILKNINIKNIPKQYEYSRLQLEYSILSKRKLQTLIDNKIVKGWDDPRMPTISGLKRRGYTPQSITNFCKKIGITKQENIIELSLLECCIRNELNYTAPRIMAILNPIKIIITNYPINYVEKLIVPNHPNRPELGTRTLLFYREIYIDQSDFSEEDNPNYKRLTLKQEVRLRYSYVIQAYKIKKDINNNIKIIYCKYDPKTLGKSPDNRKIKGVIHWIASNNICKAEFHIYNRLFTIPNPENNKNFLNYINKQSLIIKKGLIESNIINNHDQLTYQFEREGYFYMEKTKKNHFIFNQVTTLRENKKNKNKILKK
ncbi:Glutamine--tRNA ligase [Buchnera aphidicola (Eriosoma grossulariae)]|uniref:glutamine--tRNA ligase n=1 Tax=Buchnera aphidicola TaxID=9 RepID=UPI0034640B8A